MTPDFKRLCEAGRDAEETWFRNTPEDRSAAIVRAVLMALREVSDDGHAAIEQALKRPRQHVGHRASDEVRGVYIALDAYVDHILDTKARREKALQDLADVDRDLL